MKNVFSIWSPLPINEANLILCASPPDRVLDDWPNDTYPNPTDWRGKSLLTIFVWLYFLKNWIHSSTVIFNSISILTPLYLIAVTSSLNLLPLQISHSSSTSAINCISILTTPSPLHSSHLPPSVLKEKNFDLKPFETDWGILA